MIVKVGAGISNYTGVINYHDRKVSEGKAEVLTSSFGITERKSVIDYLTFQGEKNTHVKNKGHDIPFSFSKNDVVSNEKALIVMYDYLTEMGFKNHPYIIYKHDDKQHQHYHVVVSNVDEFGTYNQTMRGLYKKDSQRISRELELKHELTITEYTKVDKGERLEVLSVDDFSLHNGIMKALNNQELSSKVKEIVGDSLDYIKEQPQTNDYLQVLIGNNFNELEHYLKDNGILKKSLKTTLISILDESLIHTNDIDSYINFAENKGLYVRYVKSLKEFSYGINNPDTDTMMYFKEKHLPIRFHSSSFWKNEQLKSYPIEQQKNYIKNSINQALKQVKSKEAFIQYLALRNVEVIFNENKAGIQGVGFKTLNIENPTFFKGSDVHRSFSWNKLKEQLDNQVQQKDITLSNEMEAVIKVEKVDNNFQFEDNNLPIDINDVTRIRKFDKDDDEDDNKKRRRNSNRNR
ncbi:MAG: relaxase/mobilization nuclease domain-containing protein [Flavobacteriales bacterium]|nr:relaxase/mobilization nuclease domain-containing protein [Flavobacteriales bacterium]